VRSRRRQTTTLLRPRNRRGADGFDESATGAGEKASAVSRLGVVEGAAGDHEPRHHAPRWQVRRRAEMERPPGLGCGQRAGRRPKPHDERQQENSRPKTNRGRGNASRTNLDWLRRGSAWKGNRQQGATHGRRTPRNPQGAAQDLGWPGEPAVRRDENTASTMSWRLNTHAPGGRRPFRRAKV